jgi:hypothetical protein
MQPLQSTRVRRPFRVLPLLAAVLSLAVAACGGDGGTGGTPRNPSPTLQHLDPGTLLQWTDSVTLTVTGSKFVDGAVVRVNGTPRLTRYVSPSQVTAAIPASQMQQAGTLQVTVFNPEPGGGESNAMALAVNHRVPELLFLEPAGAEQGGEAFVLTVNGAGFSQGSVVRWNGTDRPTTFVNPGRVTAQIPAADLAQVGTAQIVVFNPAPGGGASAPRVFPVGARPNPVAQLTAISPASLLAGTGATFTVTGTGFVTGSQVFVGGFAPTTTVVSPTEVQFTLQGSNLPNPGTALVTVRNPAPGGGNSNPLELIVNSPAPTLASLSPAEATVRQENLAVRLTGTGFMVNSMVLVNGQPRTAQRISATEMEVVLNSFEVSTPRTISFRVNTPAPGGGLSGTLTLAIVNPAPVVQSISPAQAEAGQDSLVVRVTGTGFIASSEVRAGGSIVTTRFVSATALDAVLDESDLEQGGAVPLTVVNAAPGGGTSAPQTLTLTVPTPVLESLPSAGASAGRPGFELVVNGRGFLRSSVVRWNGDDRDTRYISSTRLAITLTTADVASPGTGTATVHTPGGGTSAARQMTIRSVGDAVVNDLRTVAFSAGDIVYDPHSNRIYASLTSDAGARANTVVAIDPATGEITGSVGVGSNPGRMALSDDGTALWVALNGSGDVRRVAIPALTAGTAFSLGNSFGGSLRVEDMRVMPGRAGTVAVALRNTCCSPRHEGVAIFDDGVRRAQTTPGHTGSNTITFGESASVLYGYNTETSENGFRTMRVSSGGVQVTRITEGVYLGYGLQYAGGRVYSSAPTVIDAARHVSVGSFSLGGAGSVGMALDATLGRAFYLNSWEGSIEVFDINTFQSLGTLNVGSLATNHPVAAIDRLIRWGTDGLAVSDGQGIYIFRTPVAGP